MAKKNKNNQVKKVVNHPDVFPLWVDSDNQLEDMVFRSMTKEGKVVDSCYVMHHEYLQILDMNLSYVKTNFVKTESAFRVQGMCEQVVNKLNELRKNITLRELLEKNFNVQIVNFINIIIYNTKNEIVCYVPCLNKGENVYDIRNNHGVEVAQAEGNFSYNFLIKVLPNIPERALSEQIEYYIDSNRNLKIKLLTYSNKPDKTILRHMKQNGQILKK